MVDGVPEASAGLDRVFHALSDDTRRSIVARLARERSCTVSELAAQYPMSLAAVSKHVQVLEAAGLVVKVRDGRTKRCCLDVARLDDAAYVLDGYRELWRKNLDALDRYLDREEEA